MKSRNWCFTLNNPTTDEIIKILDTEFEYCIFGFETGSKKETEHLQGYIEYNNVKRLNEAKIVKRMHIENRKGNQKQAIEYCKKEGEYYEFGEAKEQGKRNDLEEIKNEIINGSNIENIADKYFGQYIRYNKAFENYIEMKKNFNYNCKLYWSDNEEILDDILKNYNSVCIIDYFTLENFRGEDILIFHNTDISRVNLCLLSNNKPLNVKVGYKIQKFKPKIVIHINDFNTYGLDHIKNASEVTWGNTNPGL